MKKLKIIKISPIRGIFDSDWDGVPNDRDCVWYDSKRHGLLWSLEWRAQRRKDRKELEKEQDTLKRRQKITSYEELYGETRQQKKRREIDATELNNTAIEMFGKPYELCSKKQKDRAMGEFMWRVGYK